MKPSELFKLIRDSEYITIGDAVDFVVKVFDDEKIINDLIQSGDTVIQVIPIDKEAPKGRLILPQVRTIRNALDNGVISIVTRETELKNALDIQNSASAGEMRTQLAFSIFTPLHKSALSLVKSCLKLQEIHIL